MYPQRGPYGVYIQLALSSDPLDP